jgi:uncharacterized integral membrane protein
MGGSVMRGLAIVFLLAFFGLGLAFCVQNVGSVPITLLAWTVEAPLYALAVAGYLLGALTGWGVAGFVKRSWRRATEQAA